MRISRYTFSTLGSVLAVSLLLAPVASFAQKRTNTSGGGGATSRRDTLLTREADLQNRELRLRLLTEGGRTRTPQLSTNDRKLIVSQIFEDFERIQIVNLEMIQASSTLNPTAYKRISTLAEEMNKRAKRLKTNLGVPAIEGEKKDPEKAPAMDEVQFKASLQTLNLSVRNFVSSPLFQDPRVTDVRHLESLRRDILSIIELSRMLKKAVGQLH
jgi:hypothetical protein